MFALLRQMAVFISSWQQGYLFCISSTTILISCAVLFCGNASCFFISWGTRRLCFSLYIPFHNFFRNFFCKKFCSFNNIFYFYIVLSLLEAPTGRRWDGHIYIKGVTVRFGFDAIRTSQLPNVCQEQSNGDAPWDVLYIQPLSAHSISAMSW